MIGVIEEDKAEKARDNFGITKTEGGRAYNCDLGTISASHTDIKPYIQNTLFFGEVMKHDMVIMTLDLTGIQGTLSYKTGYFDHEDEMLDHGIAFNRIDVNKKYRMAISLWNLVEDIQIIP